MAFGFFLALQFIALLFAGVAFVSESLIQMSLFRFSIYAKLLSCIGASAVLLDERIVSRRALRVALLGLPVIALVVLAGIGFGQPESAAGVFVRGNWAALLIFVASVVAGVGYTLGIAPKFGRAWSSLGVGLLAAILIAQPGWLGVRILLRDDGDADYLALCDFVREHTPVDAVFVVPPNEQLFRYRAQRAIVVNFKNVPQLSSEMGEWKERLEAVLGEKLGELPRRFDLAHEAIARRYESLSDEHLKRVARKYEARYVVATRAIAERRAVFEKGEYRLYDLHE